MFRLRFSLISAALVLGLAALTLDSRAQGPGQGGGQGGQRGGFGRGGPGGFGGFGGGPGGPGGSLLGLASNPAVQEDLKLEESQKTRLKSLSDLNQNKSQELRTQFGMGGPGQNGGGPGGQNRRGRGNGGGNGGGGNGGGGNGGGGGGGDGGFGGNGGGGGNANPGQAGGNGGQGGGNRGGFGGRGGQRDPAAAARFQAMREAMDELRQSTEQALARILSRGQLNRLRQIQLQLEGPSALVRDEIAEKLNLDEFQVEQIRELMGERRQAQRQSFAARGNIFRQMRPNNQNADGGDNADDGGNNGGGNRRNGGNANANGANGNGGNGNRGNNRRPDPEAIRKFMEQPEVKAKMEEFRGEQEKLESQFAVAVNKVLSPRQRTNYKKMLGPPFDRSKMGGGPFGGFGGRGGPGQANAKGATKAAPAKQADDEGDGDDTVTVKTPTAKPTAKPAATPGATKSRVKSLRERRGLGGSSDDE
ncbi:MAG: hypothetical protein ACLQVF_33530 [Isosphaeraceae bacterium]